MKRRAILVLAALAAVAGCAKVSPAQTVPASPSPTAPPVVVGETSDPTTRVLAALYVQGLAAKGRPARIVPVPDDPAIQVRRLMSGELDVVPAFAWSAARALQVDSSDPERLVSDLATALDGEVAVLQPSRVDRAWRYLSTSGGSLGDLPRPADLAAPVRWRSSPDGPSGLAANYHLKPKVSFLDDPGQRLARVKSGMTGVFDATEPEGRDPALKVLDDPKGMISSDPQVALLRSSYTSDDTVLDVLQQLHETLDNGAVIDIRQRAVTVGVEAAVTEWLLAHPLR